ncbi:toll/interleukin-1 receptor domain-containing protein [Gilliamella sp. B2717]|uniref:DUF4875 domain-containing protein n=1 Tax=Gilliamella sp. B2717 TaxID=2817996 RepID=UPI0022699AA7|nr:toll/interleukin-1 receptor domain-containing protein [Gilliamella sp. B2717]MCX8578833.1 toll/interleukin-1 receptor domain-containing protein [Gilliamella sp. B2717]
MKKLFLSLTIFLIPFCFASEIKQYEIISENDTSFASRSRAQIFIVSPETKNLQQRVDTAKIAATDYSSKTGAKVVSVFLMPFPEAKGTGFYFARVNYYSDGCGNSGTQCNNKIWEVMSTDQQLSDKQLKIAKEYYSNADFYSSSKQFLDKDGLPDEKKIINHIAKKLKINAKNIDFPSLFLESVE